ncbi:MAG: hypothetical protein Q7R41_06055, partial [Phycisphaerales bacterium]|nr:hypothetical protein [Phycisphaerales bacterium]
IPLTATEEDVAKIYLRYRLYTYQPDEMITMMALAGMRPSQLQLDPRLYQYGGLFIYPVGALIKLCGLLGLIDVRSDVVYYLDHPDEFGKFYIVARAYSAAWGLLGVILVYALARRMAAAPNSSNRQSTIDNRQSIAPVAYAPGSDPSHRAGLLAALFFALMPVVVCMSHEGKPHLPGAVLMLAAVYFAMRTVQPRPHRQSDDTNRPITPSPNLQIGTVSDSLETEGSRGLKPAARSGDFRWMSICCGAAVGMVLSSWPICVLIPLVAWIHADPPESPLGKGGGDGSALGKGGGKSRHAAARTAKGVLLAVAVYFATNPYVLINAFFNRDVLRSNFGNSLAMYQITRIGEGFVRVLELTVEGATLPVLVLGLIALVAALAQERRRTDRTIWVLVVPAAVFFLQFVAIGAGKPAEYGRFGIFPNAALAIGAACLLNAQFLRVHGFLRWVFPGFAVAWVAAFGGGYLRNFYADATDNSTRLELARYVDSYSRLFLAQGTKLNLAVLRDPAPYDLPPLSFANTPIFLVHSRRHAVLGLQREFWWLTHPVDSASHPKDTSNDSVLQQFMFRDGSTWETPISWANKPFVIECTAGVPSEPGVSVGFPR